MQSNKGPLDQLSGLNEWNAPSVTSQHRFSSFLNLNWQVGIFTRPPWRTSWQVMLWFTEVSERAAPSCAPSSTTPSGCEVRMFSAGGRDEPFNKLCWTGKMDCGELSLHGGMRSMLLIVQYLFLTNYQSKASRDEEHWPGNYCNDGSHFYSSLQCLNPFSSSMCCPPWIKRETRIMWRIGGHMDSKPGW